MADELHNSLPLFDYAAKAAAGCRLVQRRDGRPTIFDRWQSFHAANPQVFEAIRLQADEQRKAGRRRISMKMIFEILRSDPKLQTDGKPFKLNNTYTALYARELVRQYPVFGDLLEIRDGG